jgi:hypothetical protein
MGLGETAARRGKLRELKSSQVILVRRGMRIANLKLS